MLICIYFKFSRSLRLHLFCCIHFYHYFLLKDNIFLTSSKFLRGLIGENHYNFRFYHISWLDYSIPYLSNVVILTISL